MGLVVDSINKSFGQLHVIKDLSMEVREGSIFGFLGANGAGKTTTMRMILDIIRPDSGRITWNGQDVREVPRRCWGYLPEERGLYPKVSVEDQLVFLARLNGLSKSSAHKHLDEWLERFQITEYRKKKVEELLVLDRAPNKDLRFTYYTTSSPTNDSNVSQVQALVSQLNVLDKSSRLGLIPAQTSDLFAQPQFSDVNLSITGASITLLVLLLVYFILGFLLYATLFAAVGALVKRQDEVQNAVAPISMLLVAGYIVSFFGIYMPDALWIKVISYVPFWTPTTMLVRIATGGVAPWEIAFTIVLMIAAIIVCAFIAGRIYRAGVLMYGQRPGLGQLVKLVRMR